MWTLSFNSLQTGNCIQTDTILDQDDVTGDQSFNSLQTGNCIQTNYIAPTIVGELKSFNSLQTGNCIQTVVGDTGSTTVDTGFQFPSNGKLHSNAKTKPLREQMRFGFNSLQTGNCIQTSKRMYQLRWR